MFARLNPLRSTFDTLAVAEQSGASERDGIVRFAWTDLPSLREAVGTSIGDDRYIAWQYDRNPLAPADRRPLFVHLRDGRVEGQVGARLVRLKAGSSEVAAHWITNLVVSPGAQKRGIGTALHRACAGETGIGLALDVSQAGERVLFREGAVSVGMVPMYTRVLSAKVLLEERRVKGRAVLAPLATRVLRAFDGRAARLLQADPIRLVEVERFSAAADEVWRDCARHYPVLVRRDRTYLNWRFAEDPFHRYRLFEVCRGAYPVGVAVLRVGEWGGIAAGFVVDYLCAPRDAEALFAASLQIFREAGVAAVYCLHANPVSTGMLRRLGFLRRGSGLRLLVCAEDSLVRDGSAWFVTLGDSNVDRPRPPAGS
jgi:GNAT superfamily N-acetyltransferase